MGGGGGKGGVSGEDLRPIAERVKGILRDGDQPRKNVFLARAYEDEDEVNLFRGQAKNPASRLEFNDHSLKGPLRQPQRGLHKKRNQGAHKAGLHIRCVLVAERRHQPMGGLGNSRESAPRKEGDRCLPRRHGPPAARRVR